MLPLVRIRRMGGREVELVAGLIRRYFPDSKSAPATVRNKLSSGSHFFVAKLNSEVVGFLEMKLRSRSAFIVGVATERDYSGRGIGTALIERAINFAKSKGRSRISLVVKAANVKAINLYRRYGFIIKRTKHGLKEDVFLMSREIEN